MRSFILCLFTAGIILAQQPPPTPDAPTVFHTDTRIVVCHTTVVDKNGHLITTLPKSAFTVFENKIRQDIRKFKSEDVPVSLGLVIDNSGSMRNKLDKVKAAALALVQASNHDDEVFIVNFNDTAYLDNPKDKDFTNDIGELEDALKRIDARGGTAMRDAIQMSIDHLKKGHRDKKVLVVITDGNDNSSVVNMERIMKSAHQSDVLIYGVGLLTEEEHREAGRARKALNDLAEATGGKTFFPKDVSEVDAIAHQVAHDIRSQYTIEYSPTNAAMDGTFRAIKIAVRASGNPSVRTRSGYYATPDAKTADLK
ncbi:MAG: von Willebrand factor, type [Candidatus Solibacter sp.]|jgi:Ca-activated chloride channel family protein|nr:von Willebrand factor, type [Candidatus Solibacter sp.]